MSDAPNRGPTLLRGLRRGVETVFGPVTALGRTLAVGGIAAWFVGARLGWQELLVLAGACLVALILAIASTIGRLAFDISVAVEPPRVVVGGDAVASVTVRNRRARPSLGTRVEVPVGAGVAVFDIGTLAAGGRREEPFVIPTDRRAIIPIGPARSVKGDALGIARREVSTEEIVLLHVHPRTIVLPEVAVGRIRDLEGRTTDDLSTSDVAFHTLRDYVPGDDRRHIHWRTSARLGTLMVRQFVDTRRSHLGILLTDRTGLWADDADHELAVSAVGSLGRTMLTDRRELTVLVGTTRLPAAAPDPFLDALSGVETDDDGLPPRTLAHRVGPQLSGASVITIVTGSRADLTEVRAAAGSFGRDVEVLVVRCRTGADPSRRRIGNLTILEIGELRDLARILTVTTGR